MNTYLKILLIVQLFFSSIVYAQDGSSQTLYGSPEFKTQLSTWLHYNPDNAYDVYLGARALPQFNFEIYLPENRLIDFEASANLVGDAGFTFSDSIGTSGKISPYRLWARYSSNQFELRLGLQKIDFGTAQILRSLRWFDQVDPRDPLQITNGVYAALFRYYFLDNTNIWFWTLYGNEGTKGMELLETNSNIPEAGARIQSSLLGGEIGLAYHYRQSDSSDNGFGIPEYDNIGENRVGLDAKWDLGIGIWLEAALVNKSKNLGPFTNQKFLTLGSDYTFALGSGLNVLVEHMYISYSQKIFQDIQNVNFSALSLMYPISMFDNIQAMFYYDWSSGKIYNFVNWFRQFDSTTLYLMAYLNPETVVLPTGNGEQNQFGGAGIQLMYVINF